MPDFDAVSTAFFCGAITALPSQNGSDDLPRAEMAVGIVMLIDGFEMGVPFCFPEIFG